MLISGCCECAGREVLEILHVLPKDAAALLAAIAHCGDAILPVSQELYRIKLSQIRRTATLMRCSLGVIASHRGSIDVRLRRGTRERSDIHRHNVHAGRAKPIGQEGELLALRVHRGDGVDSPIHGLVEPL